MPYLSALCGILTTISPIILRVKAEEEVSVQVLIPPFTRLIIPSTRFENSGIAVASKGWNRTEIQAGRDAGQEWLSEGFSWFIYDRNSISMDDDLKDEDLLFNMSCQFEISSQSQPGDIYQIAMMIKEPYPRTDIPWSEMLKGGNIICPEGSCANEKCRDLDIPKWDRGYLQKHEDCI